jgi:hypothetical protein
MPNLLRIVVFTAALYAPRDRGLVQASNQFYGEAIGASLGEHFQEVEEPLGSRSQIEGACAL